MNYAKVINGKITELYRPRSIEELKKFPVSKRWLPIEKNKPEFDMATQYLVFDYYEIKTNKVIEHYRIEEINFEVHEETHEEEIE